MMTETTSDLLLGSLAHPLWFATFRAATYSVVTNVLLYLTVFRFVPLLSPDPELATGPITVGFLVQVSMTCAVLGTLLLEVLRRSVPRAELGLRVLAGFAFLALALSLALGAELATSELLARIPFGVAIAMTTAALTPGSAGPRVAFDGR